MCDDGMTPLHHAARSGDLEIATMIAARLECPFSAKTETLDPSDRRTAYELVVEFGNTEVAEMPRLLMLQGE